MTQLILASSSPHRADLLKRLGIPFVQESPDIDESPLENEPPAALAARLAVEKAQVIGARHPECCVIGSDQVAVHQHRYIGKPGSIDNAIACLAAFSGQTVQFLTSVAVLRGVEEIGHAVVETRVSFRELQRDEIVRYVKAEMPLDCAGSFKAESLGPSLFESVFSQDPTSIIGLPLIETSRLLRLAGFQLP